MSYGSGKEQALFSRIHSIIVAHGTLSHLLLPHLREFIYIPPTCHRQRFERDHVMLICRDIRIRCRMRSRINYPQQRCIFLLSMDEGFGKLLVREEQWIGSAGIRVEVHDMCSGKVSCEEQVEDVCGLSVYVEQ